MPCGGIYPIASTPFEALRPEGSGGYCFHCGKPDSVVPHPSHFVEEWDAYIHQECIESFLETEDGKIVLVHKHCVRVDDSTLGASLEAWRELDVIEPLTSDENGDRKMTVANECGTLFRVDVPLKISAERENDTVCWGKIIPKKEV